MQFEEKRPGGRLTREAEAAIAPRLVRATFAILQRRGLAASMDEIAQEAGISKQAIYRRFSGKIDLIRHVVELGLAELIESQQQLLAGIDDPLDALRQWARLTFEAMSSPEWIGATALFRGELAISPDLADDIVRWERRAQDAPAALVDALDAAGLLTTLSAQDATEILLDLIAGAQRRAERAAQAGILSADWIEACFESRWRAFTLVLSLDRHGA